MAQEPSAADVLSQSEVEAILASIQTGVDPSAKVPNSMMTATAIATTMPEEELFPDAPGSAEGVSDIAGRKIG